MRAVLSAFIKNKENSVGPAIRMTRTPASKIVERDKTVLRRDGLQFLVPQMCFDEGAKVFVLRDCAVFRHVGHGLRSKEDYEARPC